MSILLYIYFLLLEVRFIDFFLIMKFMFNAEKSNFLKNTQKQKTKLCPPR